VATVAGAADGNRICTAYDIGLMDHPESKALNLKPDSLSFKPET
jgi:hypothetical protein